LDGIVARVRVSVIPEGAGVAVDGRPLEPVNDEPGVPTLVAGTRPPGPGEPAPPGTFVLLLDPGAHVFTISRKGFTDAVVNRTLAPGARSDLNLELSRLPASLRISADREGALVTVGGVDVGPVPVEVLRPAGAYRVSVKRAGFVPYETRVNVGA